LPSQEEEVIIFGVINEEKLLQRSLLIDESNPVLIKRLKEVKDKLAIIYQNRGKKRKRKRENGGADEDQNVNLCEKKGRKGQQRQKENRTAKGRFQKRRKIEEGSELRGDSGEKGGRKGWRRDEMKKRRERGGKGKKIEQKKVKPYSDQEDSDYLE
jgi:hypothetical protein